MDSDVVDNDPEGVIMNDGEKTLLGTWWAEIQFSPNYSDFYSEKLKFDMVTQIRRLGKTGVTFIKHYPEACDQSYILP